jgi:hypothetical protein
MTFKWIFAVVAVFGLLLTGCGGSKPPAPASSSTSSASTSESASESSSEQSTEQQSSTEAAPAEKLDPDACVEVTSANLDLATATNNADAQKAADVFAKYNPPADVQAAIDHFVSTGGVQFDDPDFDKFNSTIDAWVKQVCPL